MSERKVSQLNSTDLRVVRKLVWISLGRNVLGVLSSSLASVPVDLELRHSDTGRGLKNVNLVFQSQIPRFKSTWDWWPRCCAGVSPREGGRGAPLSAQAQCSQCSHSNQHGWILKMRKVWRDIIPNIEWITCRSVWASEENHSDPDQIRLGDLVRVWRIGLQEYRDDANNIIHQQCLISAMTDEVMTMMGARTKAKTVNSYLKDEHMSALRDGPHVHSIKSLNFPNIFCQIHVASVTLCMFSPDHTLQTLPSQHKWSSIQGLLGDPAQKFWL